MNNYKLAKEFKGQYPGTSKKIERCFIDVKTFYSKYKTLPFKVRPHIQQTIEEKLEETEPDTGLKTAA
jgi:hypothetical protein